MLLLLIMLLIKTMMVRMIRIRTMMFMMMSIHIRLLMMMRIDAYDVEVDEHDHDIALLMPMIHFVMFLLFSFMMVMMTILHDDEAYVVNALASAYDKGDNVDENDNTNDGDDGYLSVDVHDDARCC